MIAKNLFRFLIWRWSHNAQLLYPGLGNRGELFDTASFQESVFLSVGWKPSSKAARELLTAGGYWAKRNSSYWFSENPQS